MNGSELSTTKSSIFNNTLFKTVLVAALAMLCVVATKSMLSGQGSRGLVLSAQSDRVSGITELLALQSGGAIKSGNQLAVSKSMKGGEAGQAGEAGRGFAVVATEVRALAQRSSDAAREINALITDSAEHVRQGVDLVDRTGSALASIVSSVSDISECVAAIASSAREQSSGLIEINIAVNELDHVTQQNAVIFEETTAASHVLSSEADKLAAAVAKFNLGDAHLSVEQSSMSGGSMPGFETKRGKPAQVASIAVAGNTALAVGDQNDPKIDAGWEEF